MTPNLYYRCIFMCRTSLLNDTFEIYLVKFRHLYVATANGFFKIFEKNLGGSLFSEVAYFRQYTVLESFNQYAPINLCIYLDINLFDASILCNDLHIVKFRCIKNFRMIYKSAHI